MTFTRIRRALVGALIAMVATSAAATQKADKIAITPESEKAAVIVKAVYVPISPPYQSGYRLIMRKYDPELEAIRGGPFGGSAMFEAKPKLFYDGYMAMDLKPGTYVITEFSRQDRWALCFADNSVQFTVAPGEVLYLGQLSALGHVAELERKASSSGRTVSTHSEAVHFFDDITPPMLRPIDADDLAGVGRMMQKHMPKTTVQPKAAMLTPARFGTGNDLFGSNRVCTGYYTGPAEPKS